MFILKNHYFKILPALLVVLLCGCSDDDDNKETPPVTENNTLSLDRQSLLFDAEGLNSLEVLVRTTADIYEATCDEGWVTITPGNNSFFVSAAPYTEDQARPEGFPERRAFITVVAGSADPQTVSVTQYSPLEQRLHIKTEPGTLHFETGQYTATVEVISNIPNITYSVPDQYDWLSEVDMTANVIAVTVPPYIGEEEREGYIIITSPETDLHYKLWVTQDNEVKLDLEGSWDWTGLQWYGSTYNQQKGRVEIVYNEQYDHYLAEPFEEFLTGMGGTEGGMAFRVNENNQVTFIHTDRLNILCYINFLGFIEYWYSCRNAVAYADIETGDRADADAGPGDVFTLQGNSSSIIFPSTGTVDGTEYAMLFGFGGYEYDPESGEETGDYLEFLGLWKNLVFTKAE